MIYHLNIGSNLGNKQANLERAVGLIAQRLSCTPAVSRYIETEAWGFESDNTFLNVAVMLESEMCPQEMLSALQSVEKAISTDSHRNEDGSYRNRTIDIDIIAIDEMVIDTPALTVPHPRMHLRDFVLKPMCELNPEWLHPLLGKTAKQLLGEL